MRTRRQILKTGLAGGASFGLAGLLPAWAQSSVHGNHGLTSDRQTTFDLHIDRFPVRFNGKSGTALGVNGTVPAPLIRFREGDEVTLNVHNRLDEDTSIHWHGLLVPFYMDGVPGVSFPGIKAGETFQYKFSVPQNGTYWYHSHSGLQEQLGHYGPIIIEPKGTDPVQADREYVMVLSDWTYESPYRIFDKLKSHGESLNFNKRTQADFAELVQKIGFGAAVEDRMHWGEMRMSSRDISDVAGETYTYLINGHGTQDNWSGLFEPGERVRLRIINASAMTIFNVRLPGLPMSVVQSDGLHVQPVKTDELQIGVAETYDVIIEPTEAKPYAFVAESIERLDQVVATFAPRAGMRAKAPALRETPELTMKDMGMDHAAMGHAGMDHGQMDMGSPEAANMDMSGHKMGGMDHGNMNHGNMDHGGMDHAGMDHSVMETNWPVEKPDLERGPGVANIAMMPTNRMDEPGLGLENMPHRCLTYSQLRSLEPNKDRRLPDRELEIHLTSNMERYMWSFDGVKFSEIKESIRLQEGERVRFTLINDTMMSHPIHLHGMFFDLVIPGYDGPNRPRKHTVITKPGEKLSFDVSAEHVGDWAFHCHLLYHMHAGMMNVVSVMPGQGADPHMQPMNTSHDGMDHGGVDHGKMDHGQMKHDKMHHGDMHEGGQDKPGAGMGGHAGHD